MWIDSLPPRIVARARGFVREHERSDAAAQAIAVVLACCFVALFALLALQRLFYPFELTWLESYMLAPVLRVLARKSMYEAPSLDYTAGIYPPLYFHLSAALCRLLGSSVDGPDQAHVFLSMRLVSVASTLFIAGATMTFLRVVRRAPAGTAFVLGSMYCACFGRLEGWLDSSRVDALMCALYLPAMMLLIEGTSWRSALLAGVLAGLAGLVKQPALLFVMAMAVFLAVTGGQWRRLVVLASAATATIFGYLAISGDLGNPFLRYWLFEAPSRHRYALGNLGRGLGFMATTLPILLPIALAPLARLRPAAGQKLASACRQLPAWSVCLLLTAVGSLALRAKEGASINYFMPVLLIAPIAAYDVMAGWRPQAGWRRMSLVLALPIQLVLLAYDPRPLLPTYADAREAERLVCALRAIDGPIWFATFPSYARLAGKPSPLHDAGRVDLPPDLVTVSLAEAARAGHYGALLLPDDDPSLGWSLASLLQSHYQPLVIPLGGSPFLDALHGIHFRGRVHVRRDLVSAFLERIRPIYNTGVTLASATEGATERQSGLE